MRLTRRAKFKASYLLRLIIISLAVAPAFTLGAGDRNLLLIGIMGLSPLLILIFNRFHKSDIWLVLLMISLIAAPMLNQPQSMRWSTVLYSCMFCVTFMAYTRLLSLSTFKAKNYLKLLKLLIYAYALVLLIQQFCVLTGLPIFNVSNYDTNEPWKLNALAAEPSHSARIVALLMYCYISVKELIVKKPYRLRIDFKSDKWVWLAFIWTMLTMGSGTAFLFIGIILLKFIQRKNIVPLLIVLSIMIFITASFEISAKDRTFNVFLATLTLDPDTIIEADHSASFRIVPTIVLSSMLDINSFDGWLGHGIDSVSDFMYQYLPRGGEEVSGGGFLLVWYEYGFITFLLLIIFTLTSTYKKGNYLNIIFWFLLVFVYGVNNQIVWLTIILLFTNNFFASKQFKPITI